MFEYTGNATLGPYRYQLCAKRIAKSWVSNLWDWILKFEINAAGNSIHKISSDRFINDYHTNIIFCCYNYDQQTFIEHPIFETLVNILDQKVFFVKYGQKLMANKITNLHIK